MWWRLTSSRLHSSSLPLQHRRSLMRMCWIVYQCKGRYDWSKATRRQQMKTNSPFNVSIYSHLCKKNSHKAHTVDVYYPQVVKHVYSSLFVSQGELHLHADLWTCHPVEKTWAGRHRQCQCPELTPSFSLPDSFIGFVAPSPCHLQSQGSEWHIEEEVGPLTTPPATSNLHSNMANELLL